MQLASKMRFLSAQFEAFLSNNLWLQNAQHANKMAQLFEINSDSGWKYTVRKVHGKD